MSGPESSIWVLIFMAFTAVSGVAVVAWMVYDHNGRRSRCMSPGCGKYFARVVTGRRLLDQRRGYKMVTNHDSIILSQGSGRWTTGSVSRSEQVRVLRQYWEVYYICRVCGYSWSKQTITELTDFNL
jgi:hypothetical protein